MKLHHSLIVIAGLTLAFHLPAQACGNRAEMLKKYDTNGDGVLDDTEKAALKADRKAKCEARKAAMLKKFDANGDGKLDDTEKAAMKAACKEHHCEGGRKHSDESVRPQPKNDTDKDSAKPDSKVVPPVL